MARPEELSVFLSKIYEKCPLPISIKTRIGKDDREEFLHILDIYNRFPVKELIVHPRIQREMYKGKPDWDMFEMACEKSRNPLCYNGDINTVEDYERFTGRFPQVDKIMIGRGLLSNPGLIREIKGQAVLGSQEVFAFERQIRLDYKEIMPDTPVLFKMKELWSFMCKALPQSDQVWKTIKKTKKLSDYENIIRRMENGSC